MKTYVSPNSDWRSLSRFRICAWTETSSAETGSSATISFGFTRERPGDPDPLALAARELVREAVVVLRVQAHDLEEVLDAPLALRVRAEPVDLERLGDDEPDALAWVQRRVGVLEDHHQLAPARACRSRCATLVMSLPSKRTVPLVGSSRRMTTRASVDFPQPDSPTIPIVSPRLHRERDAVERLHRGHLVLEHDALGDREVLRDVLDLEERVARDGFQSDTCACAGRAPHAASVSSASSATTRRDSSSFRSSSSRHASRCRASKLAGAAGGSSARQRSNA